MKKLITLSLLLFCSAIVFAQKTKMACCSQSSTAKFAMLASDAKFRNAHLKPLPFHFQSKTGKTITFKTPDGQASTAYMLKAKTPTNNYLLVVHEWWGLNDYVKGESEKMYTDLGNVNVIALDLYDGKVATDKDEAGKLMQGVKEDRAKAIINGAIAYAGAKARIATIGWCFGGGWSLQTSIMADKHAIGCVMYYGMPEQDVARLKTLNTDVLAFFGNKDAWLTPAVAAKFKADMLKAGKKLSLHQYDADHAFANPSSPNYNAAAKADAYKYTLAFLKPRFK